MALNLIKASSTPQLCVLKDAPMATLNDGNKVQRRAGGCRRCRIHRATDPCPASPRRLGDAERAPTHQHPNGKGGKHGSNAAAGAGMASLRAAYGPAAQQHTPWRGQSTVSPHAARRRAGCRPPRRSRAGPASVRRARRQRGPGPQVCALLARAGVELLASGSRRDSDWS
jgi:hypothetical protein